MGENSINRADLKENTEFLTAIHLSSLNKRGRRKREGFCRQKSFQAKEWYPVGAVETFKALLMVFLDFKELNTLITVGIQDKDPDSSCVSDNTHQHVSVLYALFCFPVVDVLMGKRIHSRKNSIGLQGKHTVLFPQTVLTFVRLLRCILILLEGPPPGRGGAWHHIK